MGDVEIGVVLSQQLVDLDPGQAHAVREQWLGMSSAIQAVAHAVRRAFRRATSRRVALGSSSGVGGPLRYMSGRRIVYDDLQRRRNGTPRTASTPRLLVFAFLAIGDASIASR
jgi:hypothetical protein